MGLTDLLEFAVNFRTIVIVVICVFAFMASPFKREERLKYLFWYMLFALTMNIVVLLTRHYGNNIFLSYIENPIYTAMMALVLLLSNERQRNRFILIAVIIVSVVLNIYEGFLTQGGVNQFNSISNVFTSLTLGTLAIRRLLLLRFDKSVLNLTKEPIFWVAVGIAITTIGNLTTSGYYRTAQQLDMEFLTKLVLTSIFVTYVSLVLFWISFLKARN